MRALLKLWQAATLSRFLLQKFICLTRKKMLSKLIYVAVLIILLALFAFPTFALASGSSRHIDTGNIFSRTPKLLELEDSKEVNSKKTEEHAGAQKENVKGKAVEEQAEKALEEEKEEEPSWKIPGWQSIFTVLAVAFYGLMLTVLPKIMAKEVEHH